MLRRHMATKIILKKKNAELSTASKKKFVVKRARAKVKKDMSHEMEDSIGGLHVHALPASNPSTTEEDGAHSHIYIISGRKFVTDWDGMHKHSVDAKNNVTGDAESEHTHRLSVENDTFTTEKQGKHSHELQLVSTTYSGLHRHELVLLDGSKVESLLPSDILTESVAKAKYNLAIQSIILDASKFPKVEDAMQWVEQSGYDTKNSQPDATMQTHVFRQLSRDRFIEESLSEMPITVGVKAVFGVLKPEDSANPGMQPDVEFMTFDMIQDRITRGEEVLTENDRQRMLNLQDNFKSNLVNLKHNLNQYMEEVSSLLDKADELARPVLERYKSSYDMILQELNEVDLEREPSKDESEANSTTLLNAIFDIEKDAAELYNAFDGSSLQNFADLIGSFLLTSEKAHEIIKGGEGSGGAREGAGRKPGSGKNAKAQTHFSENVLNNEPNFVANKIDNVNSTLERAKEVLKEPLSENQLERYSDRIQNVESKLDKYNNALDKYSKNQSEANGSKLYDEFYSLVDANTKLERSLPLEKSIHKLKTPMNFRVPIYIKKSEDEEEHIVFGVVLEPNDGTDKGIPLEPDAHGDIYSADDIKKAAYSFMEDDDAGNQGFMHKFFMNDDFALLENYVTKGKTEIETPDKIVELRKGTWVMSIRVNSDSVWKMIKNGEITGFSIGGVAEVEDLTSVQKGGEGSGGAREGAGRPPGSGKGPKSESSSESRPMSVDAAARHFAEQELGEDKDFVENTIESAEMTQQDAEDAIEDDDRSMSSREEIGELSNDLDGALKDYDDAIGNYADNQNASNIAALNEAFDNVMEATTILSDRLTTKRLTKGGEGSGGAREGAGRPPGSGKDRTTESPSRHDTAKPPSQHLQTRSQEKLDAADQRMQDAQQVMDRTGLLSNEHEVEVKDLQHRIDRHEQARMDLSMGLTSVQENEGEVTSLQLMNLMDKVDNTGRSLEVAADRVAEIIEENE